MRFLILPTLTILAGGLLLAADSETVTYIDGNIADLSPNTGATLNLTNPQSMELRTPLHAVQVPYVQILKTDLGSVTVHSSEPEPLYKVWALPKRLIKSETQQVTLDFKNANGQDQTMTIEMSKPAVPGLMAKISRHNGKIAESNWWGDGYWKTTRNKDQWGGAGTVAQK
jgi:hypothetical protein